MNTGKLVAITIHLRDQVDVAGTDCRRYMIYDAFGAPAGPVVESIRGKERLGHLDTGELGKGFAIRLQIDEATVGNLG